MRDLTDAPGLILRAIQLREAFHEAGCNEQFRDEEVKRHVQQRNLCEGQLQDLAEEVTWLREKAGRE